MQNGYINLILKQYTDKSYLFNSTSANKGSWKLKYQNGANRWWVSFFFWFEIHVVELSTGDNRRGFVDQDRC